MKIISNEDMYVSTTWGAAIRLYAGEPKEVGDDIGYVALQQGAEEVKGESLDSSSPTILASEIGVIDEEEIQDAIVIEVDEDKGGKLEAAMKQILENGDPKDFTTDGLPKQSAIKAVFGEQVNSDEREEAWAKVILEEEDSEE
jgi:uncharacterized protein YuzE